MTALAARVVRVVPSARCGMKGFMLCFSSVSHTRRARYKDLTTIAVHPKSVQHTPMMRTKKYRKL